MFEIGDYVVYGNAGVCKVSDITKMNFAGLDKNKPYYVLDPVFQNGTIYSPTDNDSIMIRPIITKEDAVNLIDAIPSMDGDAYYNSSLQQLSQHYKDFLQSYDCEDLVEMTKSIYSKKREVEDRQRPLGQVDKRFMKQAEDLLFGELAVALGIEKEQVFDYIEARIGKM